MCKYAQSIKEVTRLQVYRCKSTKLDFMGCHVKEWNTDLPAWLNMRVIDVYSICELFLSTRGATLVNVYKI
jgi:hypothetical protein